MLPEILKVAATKTSSSFKPSSSLLRPVMYFFTILLLSFLFAAVSACPPDDEELSIITSPLGAKFYTGQNSYTAIGSGCTAYISFSTRSRTDICGQGIKPGGQADVDFLRNNIIPYYMNKRWLTKNPPAGWYFFLCHATYY